MLENHWYPSSPLILHPRSNPSKLIKAITGIQTVVANGSEPEQARPRNTPFLSLIHLVLMIIPVFMMDLRSFLKRSVYTTFHRDSSQESS